MLISRIHLIQSTMSHSGTSCDFSTLVWTFTLGRVVDQNYCRAAVGNARVADLHFAYDTVILSKVLEVLMSAHGALYEEAKSKQFHFSWYRRLENC